MKRILIFQLDLNGHALEYIDHFFEWAKSENQYEYFFCIPKENKSFYLFETNYKNIHFFDYKLPKQNILAKFKIQKNLMLRKAILLFEITDVILLSYDQYFPMFHFMLPSKVNFYSFLYYLYIYNWKKISLKRKIQNVINYQLLVHNKSVKSILICNGTNEHFYFNKLYHTLKFSNIVDPISMNFDNLSQKTLHVKRTFLHMGALGIRKGTIDILNALQLLSDSDCKKIRIIFAGVVSENIKHQFYELVTELSKKVEIIVIDRFCTFQEIQKYCLESDYLLIPYKGTSQSSGMLAYASAFNIPVIATNEGMLKKLVRKYRLGYLISTDLISLRDMFISLSNEQPMDISLRYVENNSILNFQQKFHFLLNN